MPCWHIYRYLSKHSHFYAFWPFVCTPKTHWKLISWTILTRLKIFSNSVRSVVLSTNGHFQLWRKSVTDAQGVTKFMCHVVLSSPEMKLCHIRQLSVFLYLSFMFPAVFTVLFWYLCLVFFVHLPHPVKFPSLIACPCVFLCIDYPTCVSLPPL